ncbi:glutamine synthetase family protein [Roseiflexus sp. RS-1]|jgi:glutamine synthetase|uniref:glutamine synthetase family protein n=1 Tax=Roseiflexus sp. (strain RS-1) TaxID=357808 RepID=UPI0000D7F813|nr:glutamine synthetase family protein [Roseiflexus sp. RS-1]ABQ89456.1 L-glutamine synthetase [Roseiflexus sp. RS-1]
MTVSPETILKQAAGRQVEFVSLQYTDIVGMVKNVTIPASELPDCLDHGVWFDGSSLEGFARVAESDMYLVPDLDTFAIVPWDEAAGFVTARMICDVHTPEGKPFAGDPRYALRRALDAAQRVGMTFLVGPEVEFFLFRSGPDGRPALIPHDVAGYFDATTDAATHIRRRMVRALQAFGIEVEATHHEGALGQHEIDLRHTHGLRAADNLVTTRATLKAIAQQQNLYATFMPKPIAHLNGNGLHMHLSLVDAASGHNLFFDAHDPYCISKLARHFIAGLLAHARGMIAILAPLVNSYKRLVPGFEAPVYLIWGRTNRAQLVRVPRISTARPQSARVELRCADPSCNPYLALAVILAAGLDGIRRELPLPPPVEEDLFEVDLRARQFEVLPSTLGAALEELQRDEVITEALGPHILERFIEARAREWEEYSHAISQWELDRYLPVY